MSRAHHGEEEEVDKEDSASYNSFRSHFNGNRLLDCN